MAQGESSQQRYDTREEHLGELKDAFDLFATKDKKDKNCLMPGDLEIVLRCLGIKQTDRDNLEKRLKEESGGTKWHAA
jgi:Ca2+-binding EF-hand superfamily protein